MKLLQYIPYVYLFFAVLFIYDGFDRWNDGTNRSYISFFFAALSLFMYFFRKRFSKKFDDKNNK